MWMRTVLLCVGLASVMAIPRDVLYPKGIEHGDMKLPVEDDVSSSEIQLEVPITFYDETYSSIFVNMNGLLSFGTNIDVYRPDLVLPFGIPVIAPFLADVDNRLSGDVYYRETRDPSLLEMAASEIHPNFPRRRNFQPRSLFIATWDHVGSFEEQYDQTNTFQVVIASDGVDSFVMFLYPEITWIRGEGKNAPTFDDVPAQAGFDAGDRRRSYLLPGSGNEYISEVSRTSNSDVPGVWMFRIGNTYGENIETPADHTDSGLVADVAPESCMAGGDRLCSINGECRDYDAGFCCECQKPFVGNGINCVEPAIQMRVNGRVTGTLNGMSLGEEANLHAFLMFKDGRVYIAVSRVPRQLGHSMQGLFAFAGGLGWLLALPTIPKAKNGYQISGGDFNRTAVIRFIDGGETVRLTQTHKGQNAEGHMDMQSTISGDIPDIQPGAQIVIPDYKDEFRRTKPGEIKAFSTHTFTVDNIPVHYTVDQTLHYTECVHRPPNGEAVQRLAVSRSFIHFDDNEQQIVRYAQSNRLASVVDENPCREASQVCSPNADCVPHQDSFMCLCKEGYNGDGQRCIDVDECVRNTHDCHMHAICYNNEGSYTCRCEPGYTGDGRNCQKEDDGGCGPLRCDRNANCAYDEYLTRYTCQCNPGFDGDGYFCERTTDCSIYNNCDRNARCLPSPYGGYKCACNEGFEGDGTRCREASCNVINNCDINADCLFDPNSGTYQCQCQQGYTGDGFNCRLSADCRRDPAICDPNARCENRGYDYICVCNPGYRGDGYRCAPVGDGQSYLMMAQGMTILKMPFTPTAADPGQPVLSIPGQTAIGIDVDCFARYFYWTDVSGKAISKAQLDGTDSQVLITGLGSPEGIAIDWVNSNMYWTDSGLDRIEVAKTDGTRRKLLIDTDLHDPRGIVVDPVSGTMFWTDWNRKRPVIERANMDGGNRRVLVEERTGLPNGLTIDFESHHVCWVDAGTHEIECINYEGGGRRSIYSQTDYPFDITYINHIFYWTDWHKKSVQNINKFASDTETGMTLPKGGQGRLYGIAVVRGQCPAGNNACSLNNGGCRRLMCLPTPNGGRTCACPDDIDQDECNQISKLL